jgi:dTDP-4-amino-4,6-dideoxyglucose
MSQIQFYRPNLPYPHALVEEIILILERGILVNGIWTESLEEYFKEKCDVKYAIACTSCTAGLTITLHSLGYRDVYIGLPAFTWPSTRYAIECNSCEPIYYDIDKETWLIDPDKHIFFEPEAIIAVDTFGNECNLETDIPVIYDAAHGYGLPNLGKRGVAEVVSFAATKVVTGGQGGIILTNDKAIALKAKKLAKLYAKITEINAFLCLETIRHYDRSQTIKERIINTYREQIKVPFKEQKIESFTNYSVYAILLEDKAIRDKIVNLFEKNGVETKVYYKPLSDLENANNIYDKILCLPVYEQIEHSESIITDIINKAIK